ncbi:hypothetical protein Hamer_G024170 [Homarus americanus]|uniref:Uncharacterized protein n=1 Tax=Homarus americanus TaxID=6706 RepID=A0A8J5JQ71_HOMAM|nr:hypothetical protein Hamer_G024170 [Homarus americanus]
MTIRRGFESNSLACGCYLLQYQRGAIPLPTVVVYGGKWCSSRPCNKHHVLEEVNVAAPPAWLLWYCEPVAPRMKVRCSNAPEMALAERYNAMINVDGVWAWRVFLLGQGRCCAFLSGGGGGDP